MTGSANHRYEVFYSGRVQGVGFRMTVLQVSKGRDVVGFVRNLPDGRVQLIAEGSDEVVQTFLREVMRRMDRNIEDALVDKSAAAGKYSTFEIVG